MTNIPKLTLGKKLEIVYYLFIYLIVCESFAHPLNILA